MTQVILFVGIDIAAETFAVAYQHMTTGEEGRLALEQTPSHYRQVVKHITRLAPAAQTQVVMEATGNYWLALAFHLHQAGCIVSVLNPSQARHFAALHLRRTKTDAVDAELLCRLAQTLRPACWTPPPPICEQLQQRLARREDLLHMRTQERNRLHALQRHPHAERHLLRDLQAHICYLQRQIDQLDTEIAELLLGDHPWAAAARRLLTITGIGIISAAAILATTHAFARCDTPEQAAAFAGLAPHASDSGKRHGQRSVGGGGNDFLRRTLFMAAGSAVRFNPPVKTFYDRLLQRGKLKKVARTAAARKLLHIAWAVVVKQRDFDPAYLPIAA